MATKPKHGMTLNLTTAEKKALDKLCKKKELTQTAVLRQALRLYELVDANGGNLSFDNGLRKLMVL